ncbi:MAG: carotenoid 1,2-hydratase, partial [Cytophagales bacterium]|nr:carotenoid 1,2-hydratase [Cytophagales bacterium]
MKNNRKIKNQVITSIVALFLIANCLLSTVNCHAQSWKTYPYHEPGSVIWFPQDEGWHPGVSAEWWYTTAHLTGDSTGTAYSFMLTYFYFPVFPFDGFRIFNIANETTGEFFQNMQPCTYVLAQDHLDIQAMVGITSEEWVTLQDSAGVLIPFEYHLSAHSPDGDIDLVYDMVKRPLMVGDDGFVYLAETDSSYYYSQTKLTVEGTLTLVGFTEPVTGTAWIDRQWGEMNPQLGTTVWEWFSYQLSNGMDLNVWNLFNAQDQIPDTPTYRFCSIYINDSTSITTSNFTLTRQKYAWMPDNQRCYSQEWHFTYANIDLTITTNFSDQEVFLPFRFYEG